jgi:hypothetical protein
MSEFNYASTQVHSILMNGKGQTRRNNVVVRNGKGSKSVEVYSPKGTLVKRGTKKLTQNELQCIKKQEFIPGLFKDCIKPMRPNRKTLRRRNK